MTDVPKPRSSVALTISRARVVIQGLVATKFPQPNRALPVSMLLERSDLTTDGWWAQGGTKVIALTRPTGVLAFVKDPIFTRARSQKLTTAARAIRRPGGAGKNLNLTVMPLASETDAAAGVESYGKRLLEQYSRIANFQSFAIGEHDQPTSLEPIQTVEYSVSTSRGLRTTRAIASHVGPIFFSVLSSEIGAVTPWKHVFDLAIRQAEKIRTVSRTA
jgi:hypothetical protein